MPKYQPGDFVVSGRVKNVSSSTLPQVKIRASFYNNAGELIYTNGVRIKELPLRPGQESEFELINYDTPRDAVSTSIQFSTFLDAPIPAAEGRED